MTSFQCDNCGDRFTSKMNFDYHKKFNGCEDVSTNGVQPTTERDDASEEKTNSSSPQRGPVATQVTGTVHTYDEDGGFGFIASTDVTRKDRSGESVAEDIFVHISDVDSTWIEEGDQLRFTVVEGDDGLRCEDAEVVSRKRDREPADDEEKEYVSTRRHGFGHQKDDTRYGPGKKEPTHRDIRSFRDERKFR